MNIITLTTDWGLKDYYIGAVKGKIYSLMPQANVVDITHQIHPYDIEEASYILKNSFPYFPDKTIHIIGINSIASAQTPHVLIGFKNHYFICSDNGIMALVIGDKNPDFILDIDFPQDTDTYNFPEKDLFVKIAAHIYNGQNIDELGQPKNSLNTLLINNNPNINPNYINGKVSHIDAYSNIITNIHKTDFKNIQKGRKFEITVLPGFSTTQLKTSYLDVEDNSLVAFFNDHDLLEIGINKGQLASLMSLQIGSFINIEFFN
ncbi:MAG: SAM-dependent chlorinase/fluorinase [Bacteroidales bacterium]|nr:SAM-dependent chlorinase/fluorinase [Bacteroidales bacterium]MDD4575599.1 SAM-dependent chlorinase/fluorinase [Bacteroidales bacterium]